MLILVAVTINVLVNSDLIGATKAAAEKEKARAKALADKEKAKAAAEKAKVKEKL